MADDKNNVDILLATYNGARFVEQQIHSVLRQTHPGVRLLVRDDGSRDATAEIVQRFAARRPGQVSLVDGGGQKLGPSASFSLLLRHASAGYVMFCDQDDVWRPTKVETTLLRMRELERVHGTDCPILVHTDMTVVDEGLRTLNRSFWAYQHLDPLQGASLKRLLVQNVVTGCASMINRALLQKAVPIPPGALMHDWWLALAAAAFGRVQCLRQSTMLYRQHGDNQIGAKPWCTARIIRQALAVFDGIPQGLHGTQRQAREFLRRFGRELEPRQRQVVRTYAYIARRGFLTRRLLLFRHGLLKNGWIRNLGLLAAI
jgi:glycosyltransferase involved in cell wall biosynthesis